LVVAAALAAGSPVRADMRKGAVELGAYLFRANFDNDSGIEDEEGYGGRLGILFTEQHELEFSFDHLPTEDDFFGLDVDLNTFKAGYLYNFIPDGVVSPFITVGGGLQQVEIEAFDAAKAKASTWIFVIARNAWIDRLRREKVQLAYRELSSVSEESEDEAPDEAIVRTQTEDEVSAALAALSEEQRQVVRLSFFQDMPHAEIAEALSLPLGTVKSRLRLALMKLRAHLEQVQ
jgi:RNA polymerase sigma factor (sigma-70 family)